MYRKPTVARNNEFVSYAMFDNLLLKTIVKNFEMIHNHVLMIHYGKQEQKVHIEMFKFIVV
jgi:hypothetical protein